MLGTADVQALADLSTTIGLAVNMRLVRLTRRLLTSLALAALPPMLPLLLFGL